MTWRGSVTPQDRTFGSLVYLLPLLDSIPFGLGFMSDFLGINPRVILGFPLVGLYFTPFVPFVVFFALFMLVVRNETMPHFIRFNTMQGILISIILSLFGIVWQYILGPIIGPGMLQTTLFNTAFLGTLAAVGYSVAQSVMGRYAEIPTLSDAAYAQVR
jgi:uncharacterized membrane protein